MSKRRLAISKQSAGEELTWLHPGILEYVKKPWASSPTKFYPNLQGNSEFLKNFHGLRLRRIACRHEAGLEMTLLHELFPINSSFHFYRMVACLTLGTADSEAD